MMKALGIRPLTSFTVDQFADIEPNYPGADYLRTAKELGIIQGVSAEKNIFEPGRASTRGEQFQIILNLINAGYIKIDSSDTVPLNLEDFDDASSVPNWLKPTMRTLLKLGAVKGGANKLRTTDALTVAEAATLFERLA